MRFLAIIIGMLMSICAKAQIPYYAGTVGDGKLYGYTSAKFKPGINHQETYTTFQYGLGDHCAAGIDLYTGPECAYWGGIFRYGHKFSKWINIGGEVMSSFNLNDNFKFAYLTSGLYMNGAISPDSRLFWCTNTWWVINRGNDDTYSNYEYLGYTFPLKSGHSITAMAGAIHSWKFDQDISPALGCYYTINNWTFYLWGNDLQKAHPRGVVGAEFIL